jgi:hypothetical protein
MRRSKLRVRWLLVGYCADSEKGQLQLYPHDPLHDPASTPVNKLPAPSASVDLLDIVTFAKAIVPERKAVKFPPVVVGLSHSARRIAWTTEHAAGCAEHNDARGGQIGLAPLGDFPSATPAGSDEELDGGKTGDHSPSRRTFPDPTDDIAPAASTVSFPPSELKSALTNSYEPSSRYLTPQSRSRVDSLASDGATAEVVFGSVALELTVRSTAGRAASTSSEPRAPKKLLLVFRSTADRDATYAFCAAAHAAAMGKVFAAAADELGDEASSVSAQQKSSERIDALIAARSSVDTAALVELFRKPMEEAEERDAAARFGGVEAVAALDLARKSLVTRTLSRLQDHRAASKAQAAFEHYGFIGPPPYDGRVRLVFPDAIKPRLVTVPPFSVVLAADGATMRLRRLVVGPCNSRQAFRGVGSVEVDLLLPTVVASAPDDPLGVRFVLEQIVTTAVRDAKSKPHGGNGANAETRRRLMFVCESVDAREKWIRWFAHALGRADLVPAPPPPNPEDNADEERRLAPVGRLKKGSSFRCARWETSDIGSNAADGSSDSESSDETGGKPTDCAPRGEGAGAGAEQVRVADEPRSVEPQDAATAPTRNKDQDAFALCRKESALRRVRIAEPGNIATPSVDSTTVDDNAGAAPRSGAATASIAAGADTNGHESVEAPVSNGREARDTSSVVASSAGAVVVATAHALPDVHEVCVFGIMTDVVGACQRHGHARFSRILPTSFKSTDKFVATISTSDVLSSLQHTTLAFSVRLAVAPGVGQYLDSVLTRLSPQLYLRFELTDPISTARCVSLLTASS